MPASRRPVRAADVRLRLPNYTAKRADLCAHFTTASARETGEGTATTNDGTQGTRRRDVEETTSLVVALSAGFYGAFGLNCAHYHPSEP